MSKEVQAILDAEREEGIQIGEKRGREEGIQIGTEKGRKEGKTEGMINAVLSMFKKELIELSAAANELGMSEKEFLKLAKTA